MKIYRIKNLQNELNKTRKSWKDLEMNKILQYSGGIVKTFLLTARDSAFDSGARDWVQNKYIEEKK